jgi:hypothetical protein
MWLKVDVKDLQVKDVVRITGIAAYSVATVINKNATFVTLYRPYVHTSDNEYVGGVIPYIGIEKFEMGISGTIDRWEAGK